MRKEIIPIYLKIETDDGFELIEKKLKYHPFKEIALHKKIIYIENVKEILEEKDEVNKVEELTEEEYYNLQKEKLEEV
ncbi:MAG: hypothetical protein ACOCRX_06320 [Candidatus Woesearchaeota archaeon]